jgi:PTH1 family peptidyl-tRNA hydrolase
MKKEKIKLIYGIGNENKNFENTKHNLGKEIIKYYLSQPKELQFAIFEKFNNLILSTNLGYMNESGKGLKELQQKLKIKPENILVIHDDADLVFPLFKTSFNSNSAGHKGIDSIIKNLKTKKFWRFRIGIQKKERIPAEEIVLKKLSLKEKNIFEKIKRKFKIILEKLENGYLPNELNLPKNFFINGN